MFCLPFSHPLGVTNAAFPAFITPMIVGVLWSKLMAIPAVRSRFHQMRGMSWRPLDVFATSHHFQVRWIAAATGLAPVMEVQSFRDRPNQQFVNDTMHVDRTIAPAHDSVPIGSDVATPEPAARKRIWVNHFLNALGQSAQLDVDHCNPSLSEMMGWGQFFRGRI